MLQWQENDAAKKYSTGVDRVALYVGGHAIAWNGVTAVNEAPSGAESNKIYADNGEYLNLISNEEFGATIEAYQKPDDFDQCEGIKPIDSNKLYIKVCQQPRAEFAFAYRTLDGDAATEAGTGKNYTYHVVYKCKAGVSAKDHATVNDSPEAATNSWEISTTKAKYTVNGNDYNLAVLHIPCATLTTAQVAKVEKALYGDATTTPTNVPTPQELYQATVATN